MKTILLIFILLTTSNSLELDCKKARSIAENAMHFRQMYIDKGIVENINKEDDLWLHYVNSAYASDMMYLSNEYKANAVKYFGRNAYNDCLNFNKEVQND